ncbi:MAG: DUF1156 domain-containing protein [Snowella sp.]|nr:DUF1156 domain-containing protein [Snowella sp.]
MTTSKRPPVFIEKIFPVKLLNEQVYYEHGGNPFKGLHRWYSRKPLSFSRASVLGSILPADVSLAEFEYLLGLYSEQEFEFWQKKGLAKEDLEKIRDSGKVKLYKTPPTEKQIKRVHDLCDQIWGKRTPAVLDPFAGGGSIPFEAARYGLEVFASDLNPVAVVTMKAAMEYPLKFGPALQADIDKWVKWVGDEAEKRLAEFFPSQEGEMVQNYLWAHTVVCPNCESVIPLSPNWWVDRSPGAIKKGEICAVKPIPNRVEKRVDFTLIKGKKGKGNSIQTPDGDYNPDDFATVSRSVGKCPNCQNIIDQEYLINYAQTIGFNHQIYTVAYKRKKSLLEFRIPNEIDISGYQKAIQNNQNLYNGASYHLIPKEPCSDNPQYMMAYRYGLTTWDNYFNPRQLLTLVTYAEIINEAKEKMREELDKEKLQAVITYLVLVCDRCVDKNSRLTNYNAPYKKIERATFTHALNLMWNYPELNGADFGWLFAAKSVSDDYTKLCNLLGTRINLVSFLELESRIQKILKIDLLSADTLSHLDNKSIDIVVTDPPYYDTIPYAELSDFFYVWQRRLLNDIFPDLFCQELTDKDREAVSNLGRFRNMGASPKDLANKDYEAKIAMAWSEAYRVLRDEGVLTVQFNHKDPSAWDVLAKALIDAGFEITASWAVSTENPQNLHQAKKNSVSSTVILVCRKRDPNAPQAWWDDLRPEVANLVEQRAPEFEANDITGIDLYLSAFGPALNVFSRSYPILDSSGDEVRPDVAFAEARKAIANYRFRKLVQSDTIGFDPLTQWYLLAWDAFKAREFPFNEALQLALAIGGFNVNELAKTYKLLDSTSGSCSLLTPQQRLKKRAFTTNPQEFTATYLVDALHAAIAIYEEESSIQQVRQFMQKTGLMGNDLFMKALEVAFRVIPDKAKEKDSLVNLWLGIDEIKAKVVYQQTELL